jgi:hypothetical protein
MSARDLVLIGSVGGLAYLVWRQLGQVDLSGISDLVSAPQQLVDASGAGGGVSGSYYVKLAKAENMPGDPLAKNPLSSASGLWQMVKGTWTKLGGTWGPDPTLAFGGLQPDVATQNAMVAKLTAQDAAGLNNAGIPVSDATLYAAHLLGLSAAIAALSAPAGAQLADLVGTAAVSDNRLPATVGGFWTWLQGKMG